MQAGILRRATNAESPWESGRVERHGGSIKYRIEADIDAGSDLPKDVEELEALVVELVSHENRFWRRWGFATSSSRLEKTLGFLASC
eukprot:3355245-Pyramimonas_sp.AAC.1